MNKKAFIEFISKAKEKMYSESDISKIVKQLNKFKYFSTYDDKSFNEYVLTVIESVIAGKSLYLAQNTGCFKYSLKDAGIIFKLVTFLLSVKNELSLNPRDVQFLKGLHHFKKIYELEKQLTDTLKRELKLATRCCNWNGVQFSCILTLCAYVEHLAVRKKFEPYNLDFVTISTNKNYDQLDDYSVDEIISGLGLIISIHNGIPILRDLPNILFPDYVLTKRYKRMLLIACRIRFLQELQQENEQFGYECEYKDGVIHLKSTNANKSLLEDYRIGYIKRQLSTDNYYGSEQHPSFQNIIQDLREVVVLEKVENPTRYRLRIPEKILESVCKVEELTKEEYDNINFETQELNLDIRFYKKFIYKDLTLLEYIQLRRFFLIFYYAQIVPLYKMYSNKSISDIQYFRSLIPNLRNNIFECLRPHFGSKLDTFWELNNYQKTNSKIIDLFYQPVLSAGTQMPDLFYPLCSIAAISNIGRNLFVLLKRFNNNSSNDDGTFDPLIQTLSESFASQNIPHWPQIPLESISDIDFAFLVENTVYIAECKRNFHPTDIFECRTTIDAIHKAERQLDRIMRELSNSNVKDALIQKFNLKNHNINIVPFIITGNRIFSNTNEFRYPVRHFRELITFIELGSIQIGKSDIYIRKGPGLCTEDMHQFLDSSSQLHSCFVESMVNYQRKFRHAKLSICIDDYMLDIHKLNEFCETHWNESALNPEFIEYLNKLDLNK